MSKLQYVLGWLSVVGSVVVTLVVLVLSFTTGDMHWSVVAKIAWMPFTFLWGVRRIKEYRLSKELSEYEIKEVSK